LDNKPIYLEGNINNIRTAGKNGSSYHFGFQELFDIQKKNEPLISIIIPVYQEEKIIENTLKQFSSHLRNKFNFELIVSDGGSSDRTVEISEKFADIVVRHTKPNRQTISEGRNLGTKAANGKFYVFLNADTIPENIETFLTIIHKWASGEGNYSNYPALTCSVEAYPNETKLKEKLFYTVHNLYVRFLNYINLGMGRGECHIIKSEVFDLVGGYNPTIAAGEDFDLYRRIAKIGRIGFVKEIKVFESPRRFQKYGYIKIIFYWALNAISVMFRGKSVSDHWEAVR
jgi:glycosyltransferase involved in cell wall biosynthesis